MSEMVFPGRVWIKGREENMKINEKTSLLKMLPVNNYAGVNKNDPILFYRYPIIGKLYRKRIELCLVQLSGGDKILEIGFGSGVGFPNLNEIYSEIHGLDLTANVTEVAAVFDKLNIKTYLKNGDVLDMLYPDEYFDSVLLISILEHLKPETLDIAFKETKRVLKKGGQVVYGVPVERPFMVFMYRLLGYNIREHHFSTERQVSDAASRFLKKSRIISMKGPLSGSIYEVGNFTKSVNNQK